MRLWAEGIGVYKLCCVSGLVPSQEYWYSSGSAQSRLVLMTTQPTDVGLVVLIPRILMARTSAVISSITCHDQTYGQIRTNSNVATWKVFLLSVVFRVRDRNEVLHFTAWRNNRIARKSPTNSEAALSHERPAKSCFFGPFI